MIKITNILNNEYEPVQTRRMYLNDELVHLGYIGQLAVLEKEYCSTLSTTHVSIGLFRYADSRCRVVDHEKEILWIQRHYIQRRTMSGVSYNKELCDEYIYVDGELIPTNCKRISKDAKIALNEYLIYKRNQEWRS